MKQTNSFEGHEVIDAVGEMFCDVAGVIGERFRRCRATASRCLESLREVPVEERDVWFDAVGVALIDDAIVEVQALGIRLAGAVGKNARPRDRETVALEAEGS